MSLIFDEDRLCSQPHVTSASRVHTLISMSINVVSGQSCSAK